MRQSRDADWDRLLPVAAVCLCTIVIGISATALESSLSTEITPHPPEGAPTSGMSLLALLYVLLNTLLSLFGISLNGAPGGTPRTSVLGIFLSALQVLYQYRVHLLIGFVLVIVLGLVVQYRQQIVSRSVLASSEDSTARSQRETVDNWPSDKPSNAVQQAWIEMIQNVNLENPSARTTTEWQVAAIEADLNPDAVRTITDTFEEVRYGNATVTPARRTRVQNALRQLTNTREEAV